MEDKSYITIVIGIGCLAMMSLGLALITFFNIYRKRILEKEARIRQIENEKNLEIFKAAGEAEEKQKEKLAKDLHDGIIPVLSAISRSIHKNISDPGEHNFDVDRIKKDLELMEQVIKEVRGISHDLIPDTLLSFGLIKALGYYIEQINGTNTTFADFKNKTSFDETVPFTKNDQLTIYRICLEILNNLYKHTGYKYLQVSVECIGASFVIEFMHDGKGITNEEVQVFSESPAGLGLKSLRSRTLLLNAGINYSIDEDVACVTLKIPFKP